jgi:hypothetical protein
LSLTPIAHHSAIEGTNLMSQYTEEAKNILKDLRTPGNNWPISDKMAVGKPFL